MATMPRTLEPEYMDTVDEASSYDAMDHTLPNSAFVDRLVELGARGRMLDLGCGPGHMPLLVAERIADAQVIGLDAAETMLALARQKLAATNFADRVTFCRGDAKDLSFDDASFDVVFSNTVLHHIPDPLPFLSECRRVLRPEGVLVIRDLTRPATPADADQLVELHAAEADPTQRELFRASLHAALTPGELREAAEAAGIEGFEITRDSDRHMTLQRRAAH
jgi:ubiquinone/menaquinone biosynthesis C-methylase UbiE